MATPATSYTDDATSAATYTPDGRPSPNLLWMVPGALVWRLADGSAWGIPISIFTADSTPATSYTDD